MAFWTETSNQSHGGKGWEVGTCLWSPTTTKSSRPGWPLMQKISQGDTIYHLIREKKGLPFRLAGRSMAASGSVISPTAPPLPGIWANQEPYYRVPLTDFYQTSEPKPVRNFLELNRELLSRIRGKLSYSPFFDFKKDGKLEVGQRYLSRCPNDIAVLLEQALSFPKNVVNLLADDEHASSVKRIISRQARFSRNLEMIKKVKRGHDFACMVCGYKCEISPGVFYAEGAHLRPLGGGHAGRDVQSNILVLCPNHHMELDYGKLSIDPASRNFIERSNLGDVVALPASAPLYLDHTSVAYHFENIFSRKRSNE